MNPHIKRTLVLFEQQRLGEAESEIRRLLTANPSDSAAHAIMGLCLFLQDRRADAVVHARASLNLAPSMAGFDTVTRVLFQDVRSVRAPRSFDHVSKSRPAGRSWLGSLPSRSFASPAVHFLALTAEIEAMLERWRRLLEASMPDWRIWQGSAYPRFVCRRSVDQKSVATMASTRFRQGNSARCCARVLQRGHSSPAGQGNERRGAFRSRRD